MRSLSLLLPLLLFSASILPAEESSVPSELGEMTPLPEPSPMQQAFDILDDANLPATEKRQRLQELVNANPDSAEIWAAYGEVLEEVGDIRTAISAFERATTLDRSLFTPWFRLGLIYKRGNPEPDLRRAEQAFRNAIRAGGAPQARALNELAVSIALQDRFADAVPHWEQAIAVDPDWGVLYNNLMRAAARLNDRSLAERHISGAINAERFEEGAVMIFGEWLIRNRGTARAIEVYTQAFERHPNNSRIAYYLGLALFEGGQRDEAVRVLEAARRIAEENRERSDVVQSVEWALFRIRFPRDERRFQEVKDLVFSQETNRRRQERNLRQAIRTLDELVDRHPTFWNGYFVRGVAHRRLNEPEKARENYEIVRRLYSNEPNVTMELALLTRDELRLDEAADLADQAVELAPRDPAFAMNAGFINIDAGRCDRAWEHYRRALRLVGPDATAVLREELDIHCPGGIANEEP